MTTYCRNGLAVIFATLMVALSVTEASAAVLPDGPIAAAAFDGTVRPFLQQHCVKCHGPEKHKGDLVLHTLGGGVAGEDAETWKKVAEMLATGEMPPAGSPRPSPHAAGRVLVWVKEELAKAGVDVAEI